MIARAHRVHSGSFRLRCGFSLVEVLCAILILGVGLVGITEAIALALRSSKDAEYMTAASLLAAGRIETLRADRFLTEGESEGDFESPFSLYAWKETITETTTEGLYEVVVTVVRADSGYEVYELRTLLFDKPFSSTFDTDESYRTVDRRYLRDAGISPGASGGTTGGRRP